MLLLQLKQKPIMNKNMLIAELSNNFSNSNNNIDDKSIQ